MTDADAQRAPGSALHTVIGDAPAAVLVVDLVEGTVVHADEVARQLAPDVRLPVRLDDWSLAAQLRDPAGAELSDTEHPLSRILRSEAVPGQAVSAQRRSEMGAAREPLWVVGVPMTAAALLEHHALVVFLPVREQQSPSAMEARARQQAQLHEQAVLATGLSFTVADARDPELPLVWVNPAFTAATGYGFEESIGRNCRFLQGPATDRDEVARVRTALTNRESVVSTLLNYRKDGLAFWNQVTITPIFDAEGEVTHFVGVQADVSGRIAADRERDRALVSEQQARAEAEDARARLVLLAEATEALTGELDETQARGRLLQLVVPALSDLGLFFHLRADGSVSDHLARHRDADLAARADEHAADVARLTPPEGLVESLLGEAPYRLLQGDDTTDAVALAALLGDDTGSLGVTSVLVVGLPGRRDRVRDLVVLCRTAQRPAFSQADAQLALDLGRRTGLILDNLRLYTRQSHIAQTLQRSLLPTPKSLAWVDVDARYLTGADDAEVGGDFYDLFEHPDQSVGVAVGDVEGHDVYAAAAMGQLKGLLRATALGQRLMPAATLEHVDYLMSGGTSTPVGDDPGSPPSSLDLPRERPASERLASMVFVQLEPPTFPVPPDVSFAEMIADEEADGRDASRPQAAIAPPTSGPWTVTLSSAGHLPPLLLQPGGELTFLDSPHARGPLLGTGSESRRRHDATFTVPSGSMLLLYTDGLVERRGEPLTVGLARLRDAAESAPGDDLAGFVDHLLERLTPTGRPEEPDGNDDVVLLALCLRERPQA